jgi:hypothetical protein
MKKLSAILITASVIALGSTAGALAKPQGGHGASTPSRASTVGMANRSDEAGRHGANKRGFCPPGQAKKPGRGSAFRC